MIFHMYFPGSIDIQLFLEPKWRFSGFIYSNWTTLPFKFRYLSVNNCLQFVWSVFHRSIELLLPILFPSSHGLFLDTIYVLWYWKLLLKYIRVPAVPFTSTSPYWPMYASVLHISLSNTQVSYQLTSIFFLCQYSSIRFLFIIYALVWSVSSTSILTIPSILILNFYFKFGLCLLWIWDL